MFEIPGRNASTKQSCGTAADVVFFFLTALKYPSFIPVIRSITALVIRSITALVIRSMPVPLLGSRKASCLRFDEVALLAPPNHLVFIGLSW